MGNGRERIKRETFMEEKEYLHYPEWIDAIKEEELKYLYQVILSIVYITIIHV